MPDFLYKKKIGRKVELKSRSSGSLKVKRANLTIDPLTY